MLGATASGANAASGGGAVQEGGISISACSSTGGGTWCQGTSANGLLKRCYSNYVHPNNYHSSTASMASQVDKRYNSAGYWSEAQVTAGWAYTCYTYWNNNA
jgi:hypothetical protein